LNYRETMKKLEELRRRHTGPVGCPSDTKDPDDWDWDNWDNWPEEDKEMFPLEEKKEGKSMKESVSFIDRWHDTHELLPDCDNVWFIADGKIYVGLYEPEQQIFCMADGMGVELKEVRQWKYMADKEIAGYPKEKEIIAVDNPNFPCPVTGIFSDHLVDEETGDEFSGVLLDEDYEFCEMGCDSLHWEDVFAWYHLPEEPLKVLEPTEVYPIAIDTPFKTDETVEDVVEDGAAPTVMEPTETDAPASDMIPSSEPTGEPEIFDIMDTTSQEKAETHEDGAVAVETPEQPTAEAAEGESAIVANKSDEEEKLVRESISFQNEGEEEDTDPLSLKVRDWYKETYPTDDMGDEIDDYVSFSHIFHCLDSYDDIYQYIPGDSVIRERVFEKLAELMGVDYDYVYDQYLRCDDHKVDWSRVNPDYIEDLYRQGLTTKDEHDRALKGINDAKGAMHESIRGNTRKFLDNVYEYFNKFFGDDHEYNWESLENDIMMLKRHSKYHSMNEAIKEYVEGGWLECYFDDVRNTLNKLYENTPEEIEKWADYPTDKLWDRYIAICQIYLPKAFKHFTGRNLGEGLDESKKDENKSRLREGTWCCPYKVEQALAILDIMKNPISAKKAERVMYPLYGDDVLFDSFLDAKNRKDVRPEIKNGIKRLISHIENPDVYSFSEEWEPGVIEILRQIADYDISKESVKEGLIRKPTHRIFENQKALDMRKCKFMLDKGVSRDDINKARMDGRVGQLLDTRGLHDEFWDSCKGE